MNEEDEIISINRFNAMLTICGLSHGQTFVSFEDDIASEILGNCIDAVNEICGAGAIRFDPAQKMVLGDDVSNYEGVEVPGVYRLIWTIRGENVPVLTVDDICIEETAISAKKNTTVVDMTINEGLFKYAKKIASKHGVKFKSEDGFQLFDGRKSRLSSYRQIEKAITDKLDFITFKSDEVGIQTVRVYVSQINSFNNKKYRVSHEDGVITVHFKELTKADECYIKLEKLWSEYGSQIGKNAFSELMNRLEIGKDWADSMDKFDLDWSDLPSVNPDYENKWKDVPGHGKSIQDLEDEYDEYDEESETERDYEAEALETPTREVEGLQQYFIPEMEYTVDKFDTEEELNQYREQLKERNAELDSQFEEDDDF